MDTNSEQHRHECEIRHVLRLGSMAAMKHYIDLVREKRRPAAYERPAKDVRAELEKRRGKGS